MNEYTIREDEKVKILKSKNYNFYFNKINGLFIRSGEIKDNKEISECEFSPFGPEIADIEISSICDRKCSFCYKGNTPLGESMSLETFKIVFNNLTKSKTLCQIAFGIGDIDANSDLWEIMRHCRINGVIPNITINGERMKEEYYDDLVALCGAVAVSRYTPKCTCYNAVEQLTNRGLTQTNIHMLLSQETYNDCFKLVDDVLIDKRLSKLNAIVFLSLKQKNKGIKFRNVTQSQFTNLMNYALEKKVKIGFDSCSAPLFLNAIKNDINYEHYLTNAEPCESNLFSIYVNVKGQHFPCSFLEEEQGIDLTIPNLELNDFWFHKYTINWRTKLLQTATNNPCHKNCRQCPVYNIYQE
jgi:MoaA/NifB/PqqE/SkfB family radical SAM enzyme